MLTITEKCIYCAEPMGDIGEDLQVQVVEPLSQEDIILNNCRSTTEFPWNENYDILFFDRRAFNGYEKILHSFCNRIINIASYHSGRMFVMVTGRTKDAMIVAMQEFGGKKLKNIFLDIQSFANYYNFVHRS